MVVVVVVVTLKVTFGVCCPYIKLLHFFGQTDYRCSDLYTV